ncbi:MAG: ABC transporter substrate-binding protein, partial [Dehalococcoidales bacterium]|nr:ABC transporter substrate-binding protein [Dehalococcoidales bacterium]
MVSVTLKKLDGTMVTKQIEKPRYGGTFSWAITTNPNGWDEALPSVTPYGSQINWMGHTNEELLEGRWEAGPAGTNEIGWNSTGYWGNPDFYRGNLAESWEFPDNTTIIFHIRKGVRWALNPASEASRLVNGREFTAEDVAYNITRTFVNQKTSAMYSMAGDSRPVSATATDKYTVMVKNAPGQQGYTWEYVGDWSSNYPPEVITKYGDHNKWENVVGTGPFMLTDFVPMSTGTWKKNTNYWGKDPLIPANQLPYIDTLKLFVIPDISTQMAAMRTGKIDRGSFTEEQAQTIKASSKGVLSISYLTPVYNYLGFRLDKGLPTDDINVRRALSMAINYKEIVDTYFKGHGEYLVCPVMPLQDAADLWEAYTPADKLPPAADGFDNRKLFSFQPAEAKKLLADAGYPNGFKISTIISATNVVNIDVLLIFKEYWMKNLNVEFTLDIRD